MLLSQARLIFFPVLLLLAACGNGVPEPLADGTVRDTAVRDAGPAVDTSLPDGVQPQDVADSDLADMPSDGASADTSDSDGGGDVDPSTDASDVVDSDALGPDSDALGPDSDTAPDRDAAHDTSADVEADRPADTGPELPELETLSVVDLSGAPPEHSALLLQRALDGLGLDDETGPNDRDRYFIGQHYIAWLDETGFHGELNGLWWLNGATGDELDFILLGPDERPISSLMVGENGRGVWPAGYSGAEHIEFPNRTPEPGDDPACADGDWCNQYSVNEAADYSDPDIPWWVACNDRDMTWDSEANIVEAEWIDDGRAVRLVWETRLVKEADLFGSPSGCHEDWLFSDGVRRPVFLRLGYELRADEPHFDRVFQFRNPATNPGFSAPMSIIGGFLLTAFPDAHPLKGLHRYVRPFESDLPDTYGRGVVTADVWNAWPDAPLGRDVVYGWARQPLALSAYPEFVIGSTVQLAHVGDSDNDDTGLCLCEVHGATEIGGGLLHAGISLPVLPGDRSVEARRRITMGGEGWRNLTREVFSAAGLEHEVGVANGSGWAAGTDAHSAGHLVFGPYATHFPAGPITVLFDLQIDVIDTEDEVIVTLDIYDSDAGEPLVTREVRRAEFEAPFQTQSFDLSADLSERAGHRIETRVFWHARAFTKVDRIGVYGPESD